MAKAYDFQRIERTWQAYWKQHRSFSMLGDTSKPKYYVLDMFPYPSGAGLHVGHPLGYIATDIIARYKRNQGYNVLHPMGFDAFGLPAEQYAVQKGVHPALTTEQNIQNFKQQLDTIGLGYAPEAELRTNAPEYYRWTQWVFLRLFGSWFNRCTNKAEPIESLIAHFAKGGSLAADAVHDCPTQFSAQEWGLMQPEQQEAILLHYRLAYTAETLVNWCPALGTVLANDEVINGVSERGGHPVERKPMRQWSLRITAYAERLLEGLDVLDWPKSLVEMQRNWIGKSRGAEVNFTVVGSEAPGIRVFTTRPDTIYGATFMVLAPEHELVEAITTPGMRAEVEAYREATSRRSERDRLAETKRVSGAFTGAYALNPFSGQQIPVYISEYVLAGYGTGAIMAVPGHDERDHRFAKHFNLPIVQVVQGPVGIDVQAEAYETKDETATIIHSGSLNGLTVPDAIERVITEVEERGIGKGSTQYRLRDAIFSRQRYWGAPIPIVYDAASGLPKPVSESELPVLLPHLDDFTPTGTGESPLAKATEWVHEHPGGRRETDTMPGWACSSWYFLRYADNQNQTEFASPKALAYWLPVDFYLGGAEHAVGHLLYARFWTKVLFDLGHCPVDEPFRKLVNQGMIQGMSALAYRHKQTGVYHSADTLTNLEEFTPIHVDVNLVEAGCLDVEATRNWLPQFETAQFILNAQGEFRVGSQVEKMSKRYHNVVNPDDVCSKYGADTFRMYEMFLGPLEQHKPWSTDGITGVHNFLKRFWGLFYDREGNWAVTQDEPSREELRVLHTAIKKVTEDIEGLSLNTAVSAFMICINELQRLGCRKRGVLSPLVVLLSPFAPHICEELWADLGNTDTVLSAAWPQWDAAMLARDVVNYPLQVNGKVRAQLELPAGLSPAEIEAEVLKGEELQKWLDGKPIKKVVVVPGRIVNVVVG